MMLGVSVVGFVYWHSGVHNLGLNCFFVNYWLDATYYQHVKDLQSKEDDLRLMNMMMNMFSLRGRQCGLGVVRFVSSRSILKLRGFCLKTFSRL
jgi:hypothetical protein